MLAISSPYVSFALAQAFYSFGLVAKPSPYRWMFILPVAFFTFTFFKHLLHFHNALEYTFACAVLAQLFIASSYILINDVQRTITVRDQKVPAYSLPLAERVKWAVKLTTNTRGTSWSHGAKGALPPPPSPSTNRINFVLQQIGALLFDLVLYDIIVTYVKSIPNFAINGPSFAEGGMIRRITNVLVFGLAGSTSIRGCHRICRILCLCVGITEPQDCPPVFGDIRDAYTLRRFWGRTWHQTLRWPAISHGRFLAYDVFRLKRGSKLALLVQVYTAFLVTGLIHVAGEFSLIGYWTYRHALPFFLLQAVGITFEFLVIDEIARKFALRGLPWQCLGYLWVVMWFVYTVPNFLDPLLRQGIAETSPSLGILSTFLGSQS